MTRAAGLIIKDKNIALIERIREGRKYYLFPGWTVEEGETLVQTLVREIKEELGLEVEVERLVAEVLFQSTMQSYFYVR